MIHELDNLSHLTNDWNAYGSPAPSPNAIEAADRILNALQTIFLRPTRILPSAEGGVAITFLSASQNRAVMEALNNGERFILLYDLNGNNETIEWQITDPSSSMALLERLRNHLRGSRLASA